MLYVFSDLLQGEKNASQVEPEARLSL